MATCSSFSMVSSTWVTAASPPPATAQAQARPSSTASRAERQRLDHVEPAADAAVEQHLGAAADRLDDAGSAADGRGRVVELAAAVVRHDDRVDADLGGTAGVLGIEHALEHDAGPLQCSRTQARSSQVTDGSNWESTQSLNASGVVAPGTAFSRLPNVSGLPPMATSRSQPT